MKENHLHRGVGSSSLHSGHFWTLGPHAEQMMWEAGHMNIGGWALSRQIGHLRSCSFFSMASLRNLIILLPLSRHIGQVKSSSIFTTASSRTWPSCWYTHVWPKHNCSLLTTSCSAFRNLVAQTFRLCKIEFQCIAHLRSNCRVSTSTSFWRKVLKYLQSLQQLYDVFICWQCSHPCFI